MNQKLPKEIQEKIVKVSGEIGFRHYTRGKFIGKGSYGEVFAYKSKETNKAYAGKSVSKSFFKKKRDYHLLLGEIKIQRSMHHECVVRLEHYFEDQQQIYLMMEHCENKTLLALIQKRKHLNELEVQSLTYQLLLGLKYIHSKNIIHRDIKLENLFLDKNMQLKIGDFGLACKVGFAGEKKRKLCGTPNYIAPEILSQRSGYSFEVDIWAVGVIAFVLLTGILPFYDPDPKQIYQNIFGISYTFPEDIQISELAKEFVQDLLVRDPAQRPSAEQLLDHPFFINSPFPRLLPTSSLTSPFTFKKSRKFEERRLSQRTFREQTSARNMLNNSIQSSNCPRIVESNIKRDNIVKKWVDCSRKYGLGYIMASDNIGGYFKDESKMLLKNSKVHYWRKEQYICFPLENQPKDLKNKCKILALFQSWLNAENGNQETTFVKKWIKSDDANIFVLSDQSVQAFFSDHTELLMVRSEKKVVFVNRDGQVFEESIKDSLTDSLSPINSRLIQVKMIIANKIKKTPR